MCSAQNDEDDEEEPDPRTQTVIICPFHALDFDLSSGASSSSGLQACTFRLEVRDGVLHLEPPGSAGDDYRVIGIRPVSERASSLWSFQPSQPHDPPLLAGFADLPAPDPLSSPLASLSLTSAPAAEPTTIVAFCRTILLAPHPASKVALVRQLVSRFRSGDLTRLSDPASDPPHPREPYRAPATKTVASTQTGRLGKGGNVQSRIRLLHALANIELWAIDLAVDHVARFWDWRTGSLDGKEGRRIGWGFVSDFLKVAEDEAKCVCTCSDQGAECRV